jgi:hypothetical protein
MVYEGLQGEGIGDDDIFMLSRSFFIGGARYGAGAWSGDIQSSFDEFHKQVTTLVETTSKLLVSHNLISGRVSGFMRDWNRVMGHRYASVRTLRCPGSTGGLRTSAATRAAMLRTPSSKSVTLGGTVI